MNSELPMVEEDTEELPKNFEYLKKKGNKGGELHSLFRDIGNISSPSEC